MARKKKNKIIYIFSTLLLIVLLIGIVIMTINIQIFHKEYLLFIVKDGQGNMLKSSFNNELTFDTDYIFDINYIFAEEENNNKSYDYDVNITGCVNLQLLKGEYPIQFNKLDLSKSFKLVKNEKQFTLTIPPANEFFEIIFSDFSLIDKTPIYLYDICEIDYFSLNIASYNGKDIINYKFHLSNKENEFYDVECIETNGNVIDFTSKIESYPVESIEISKDEIWFDGGVND